MIHLERIQRQFGPQVLFDELSWMIPQGARLGLVGPNGAGKTTLLRILQGRDTPDAGKVHRPHSLQIGYLPQEVETVERGSVLSVVLSGFSEVARLEGQLEDLERRLTELGADDPEVDRLTQKHGELRLRFEHLEGDRLEARARTILSGLGVDGDSFHRPLETLSGGWRMRVVLARLLLGRPGLLLLDEPTNHLDLEAIGWLEGFLESYEGAFVVVSHDRYFLNRMVQNIVELDHGALTTYPGNYDGYLAAKAAREEAREKNALQQAREIRKVERFIERFRYKNTKAKQVQSRIRALGKIDRVQTARATKRVRFGFPAAPRSGDVVVRAKDVRKSYGPTTVYDDMNLLMRRGDRVALVGPNGAGKSTLLKLLAGRIAIDGGSLEIGHNVQIRYYAQHQLDDLDPQATVFEEIEREAPPGDPLPLRKLLGSFLFTGEDVDKKVGVLSGGEKARLALARLLIRPANLLLLDEPTNHLDLRSREVLEDALQDYAGTLVVISHDRYFINRTVTSVAEIGGGKVELQPGDYDEYQEWKSRRAAEEAPASLPGDSGAPDPRQDRRDARRKQAEERNRLYRERRAVELKLEPIESEIERLERRVGELVALQSDPEVYRDSDRAAEIGREKIEAEGRLAQLYADWEAIAVDLPSE